MGSVEGSRDIVFAPLRVKNRAMGAAEMLQMASQARRGMSVGLARSGFALGLALGLLATSMSVLAEEPITAVWREQKLSFTYDSSTSIYACDALAGRVRSILRAVGPCYESIVRRPRAPGGWVGRSPGTQGGRSPTGLPLG